ncbi:MAG: family 78 glycoside hydrolase catalytic domain [Clostridia bacterium]|nr:family 78 glycoside hydrolase catalytic domain [Clostridia bacterium]
MNSTTLFPIWLGTDENYASPVITRRFALPAVQKATLRITGLGYFEATLNGTPVTTDCFLPLASDYEPRDLTAFLYPIHDKPRNRIYFHEFDVASLLRQGENVLEIQLGNGFYRQDERVAEGNTSFGAFLKATYRIDLETVEGSICIAADGTETQRDSIIRYNNLFHGEVIDYTCLPVPEKPVRMLPPPLSEISPATGTPDRLIRTITPVLLGEKDGKKIYDAGENISGVVRLSTSAPCGSRCVLRFAEVCRDDLTLDFVSTGSLHNSISGRPQIMEDVFITDGRNRIFQPRFVWHAFRYFEVEGAFDQVEVCVIHSDTPVTASFHSTLEGPQYLFDAFVRTQLNNMHGSYPSDCPHRERLGYLGDGQVCAPAAMMMLDSRAFYEKWLQDILDCQDPATGHVQHTAPFMGGGGGPGVWGSAIVFVPYAHYSQYGDISILTKCYESMLRWVDYLTSRSEDGLIVREEEGGWCLGDWCTLEPIRISVSYVNTCCFVKLLSLLEKIARITEKSGDIPRLSQLRLSTLAALRRHFYDPASGHYDVGMQGADAYAVWCGLEGGEMAQRIADSYGQLGHFDTGFVGTDILLEVLFEYGHGDVALRLMQSREPGSYLYMKDRGATTIWETWDGSQSHDHPMFCSGARQLFTGVLGIRQREGTAGWQDVIIRPCFLTSGERVTGSMLTPHGQITVTLDNVSVTVEAPESIHIAFAPSAPPHTRLITP